jgi:hypothetical protein
MYAHFEQISRGMMSHLGLHYFINLDAAMGRIKGYGLSCGFAPDCFNPKGTPRFSPGL